MSTAEPKMSFNARVAEFLYRVRRRIATALAVALAIFLGYHVIAGRNGVNVYEQKRAEDRSLRKDIDSLQEENARLKDHVDHLRSDPDAIEREARERLHYARPDEVIYTLSASPATAQNPPQSTNQPQPPPAGTK